MITFARRVNAKLKSLSKRGPFLCPVCGKENVGMHPVASAYIADLHRYGHVHNIFQYETLNLEHYSCKNCLSRDRERLYVLYLNQYLQDKQSVSLLDIAPAGTLQGYLKKQKNVRYRSMDLFMKDVDDNLDITDMHSYKEGQFDFFICSHVLEHVPDDKKAMSELYRVLKPGGKGIAMVPIHLALTNTIEDPACTDIATRWKLYGQDDHIRLYSKNDFVKRLENAGFKVSQLGIDYFGADVFKKMAIFPSSVVYIVSK